MRRACALTVALGAGLAGLPGMSSAQEVRQVVTLEEALSLASGNNPTLRQATNTADLNGIESTTLWIDQLLPRANLTLFQTAFTGNLQRQALDNFGNPIANPDAAWNYFSQTNHSLSLSWSFQGPSLFHDHRRLALANRGRELARLRAVTDVEVDVQRLYHDALEQRELMRAEEELVDARAIDLDVAERLFSLALRTRVDVLNAELAVERQTITLRRQEGAYERALLAMRTGMGVLDDRAFEPAERDVPVFDPSGLAADRLVSQALEVNPALLQSEAAIGSAEVEVAAEKGAWWPEISAGFNVFRQSFESETQALFDPSIATDLESRFYLQFSLPILNNFAGQNLSRQRASVDLANQRESDRQARLELEESVRGALLELEYLWDSFGLSERAHVIAEEALRLAREEYRLGTRSFEELRSSIEQEAETRRDIITARYAFVDALLTLEQAVGTTVRGGLAPGPEQEN